jgi:hypothetical protein
MHGLRLNLNVLNTFGAQMAQCEYSVFADVSPCFAGVQLVAMPPTWKQEEPAVFTFVLFTEELNRRQLHSFFELSAALKIPNPRPISRTLLELASIFHPLLYQSFTNAYRGNHQESQVADFMNALSPCRVKTGSASAWSADPVAYYVQSLLFLAGCTLSAAVIQNRFSEGTVDSKLNRLWQASQYAKRFNYAEFQALQMEEFVVDCSANVELGVVGQLREIKKAYGRALKSLSNGIAVERRTVKRENLSTADESRFGFVGDLRDLLGENLQCILVYGSSVTSQDFADYDLVVVVKDAGRALTRLTGMHPAYRGKDINLSIYDLEDFFAFQMMSGDNLDHNARCIYGETEIPIKRPADLMMRNFSFAFIRLRQLLGMAGYLSSEKRHAGLNEQTNLYEYFVKIPMHIMKGVRSVVHEPISKEYINAWTASELGYDLTEQMALIRDKHFTQAIANAYLATHGVISYLNGCYNVFDRAS